MLRTILVLFAVLFLLPLGTHALWWTSQPRAAAWNRADWSATNLLPAPSAERQATVHVLAARVGRWRGIFAHHSWIVIKPAGASRYRRYDVVGWGRPVRTDHRAPDGRWFGNAPIVSARLEGADAERAIARMERLLQSYPHSEYGDYSAWPGPNSNTFIAHLVAGEAKLAAGLLPTAIGKDFRDSTIYAGASPSGTGFQFSLGGMAGLTVGWIEGIEINMLGLVAGIDFSRPALKLPGWGRIELTKAGPMAVITSRGWLPACARTDGSRPAIAAPPAGTACASHRPTG